MHRIVATTDHKLFSITINGRPATVCELLEVIGSDQRPIPVSERPPEAGSYVQVFVVDPCDEPDMWTYATVQDDGTFDHDLKSETASVTHWLPKPPAP